jgi:hypothetical protein
MARIGADPNPSGYADPSQFRAGGVRVGPARAAR